jgi:hypothetical protein
MTPSIKHIESSRPRALTHLSGPVVIVSVDASCSGRRAACAAVVAMGDRIIVERSRWLPKAEGYVLAAEIGAIALAADLVAVHALTGPIILETDNPQVPRVLLEGARLPQSDRIPSELVVRAADFVRSHEVNLRVLPRNATCGLHRAHYLARKRLWRR